MRLEPIDRPASLLGWLITRAMRWRLGKDITPARVIYNRVPRMWNVSWALLRLQLQGLRLDPELRFLVQLRAAMLNRCEFCQDIAKAFAVQQRIGLDKFRDLDRWESSPAFDDRERAVLHLAAMPLAARVPEPRSVLAGQDHLHSAVPRDPMQGAGRERLVRG